MAIRNLLFAVLLAAPAALAQSGRIDLAGTWTMPGGTISLPGSTDQAFYGQRTAGPEKGWLSRQVTFTGEVGFARDVTIPETWRGKRVSLFLERVHWKSTVLVDGKAAGSRDSLTTPHVYDVTALMPPGQHHIELRVDNSYLVPVGENAHSVTEHTQTNWNGVIGRLELRATDPVWIEDVKVFPEIKSRTARLDITIGHSAALPPATVHAQGVTAHADASGHATLKVALGAQAALWDEYDGQLQHVTVDLRAGEYADSRVVSFGLREIEAHGQQFRLNGRPVLIRATLECSIFPRTGYPPTDRESWARLYRIAREHGLNSFRFHSWCPPEAAFEAADEAGFLVYVELPVWSPKVGLDEKLDVYMRAEGMRMLAAYGNHPSFIAMGLGNELRGDFKFMDNLVAEFARTDPRRLYTFSADYVRLKPGESSDFYIAQRTTGGYLRVHGARWEQSATGTDYDYSALLAGIGVPTVAHELGQWVTYPDFSEIAKYTGVLKPRNLEAFRTRLEEQGMGEQAALFQQASGRFAWKLYKEDIEACLRTPAMGGFQLLALQDFPGQGEALIGLLDSFWDSKHLLSPAAMRHFAGPTVPLARFEKFVWTNDETFRAHALVSHWGKETLNGDARWTLWDGKAILASGALKTPAAAPGTVTPLGEIEAPLGRVQGARQLRLAIEVGAFSNDWDIWVYPKALETPKPQNVLVTDSFDAARKRLAEGGRVVWLARQAHTTPIRFLPVFWSLTWFPKQPGQMGILCDPRHPALAGFPTQFHSNFQWYELTQNAQAFILDGLPQTLRPVIQVMDDYHRNLRLGAVVEARVGSGSLLAVSLDVDSNLDTRPVARQLRAALVNYAASAAFAPQVELDAAALERLAK